MQSIVELLLKLYNYTDLTQSVKTDFFSLSKLIKDAALYLIILFDKKWQSFKLHVIQTESNTNSGNISGHFASMQEAGCVTLSQCDRYII